MRINCLFVLLTIFSIIVFGCTQQTQITKNAGEIKKADGTIVRADGTMIKPDGTIIPPETKNVQTNAASGYTGKVLAGTITPYLEFNKADYDKALKEKKKILLYFYANWCPICRVEQPQTLAAFNEIKDADLIGFRVNYRDSDTDADETALAQQFGVSYQHTKIILKDGQRVGKFPDSWDKQRYLDELAKV